MADLGQKTVIISNIILNCIYYFLPLISHYTSFISATGKPEELDTSPSKARKSGTIRCGMTAPLPLTCPGQHLHASFSRPVYDDGKVPGDDPTTLGLGRLKVILMDGVVYRLDMTYSQFRQKSADLLLKILQ